MKNSLFNINEIESKLNTIDVLCFKEIDSTNEFCKAELETHNNNFLVCANKQSKGKGRTGKSFYSPDNGFYCSYVLLRPNVEELDLITIKVSLAIHDALSSLYHIETSIKWVNDIYYNHLKCAGILCEMYESSLIIGFGININQTKFPSELKDIATSLKIDDCNYNELVAEIIFYINNYLTLDDVTIIETYKKYQLLINKKITFKINNMNYEGVVTNINNKGNLIVNVNETEMVLSSGEVSLVSKRID